MIPLFLASLAVMAVSLVGVISVWKHIGAPLERNLSFLVSFSAGVFLVIAGSLMVEVFEHAAEWGDVLFWVLLGMVGLLLLFKLLPNFHHHHDEHGEPHLHSHLDARRILVGDAIHNMGDGILLAAAFSVSVPLGVLTAVSVLIHEIVQEISEFFVLRQSGHSVKKALWLNFLSSSTILIGAIGGYFLLEQFEMLEVPLLGLAAGAFLIVVFHDLIPHSIRHSHHKVQYAKHFAWFVVGIVLMSAVTYATPHEHEHEDDHMYEDEHVEEVHAE